MAARSVLRQRVRNDATDRESVRWTDAEIDDAMNHAALYVAETLARSNIVRQMMGTETFTSAANDRSYTLTATDIMEIKYLYLVSQNTNGQDILCDPVDDGDREAWDGKKFPYYVNVESSAATRLSTIEFVYFPPSSRTFRAEYVKMPAEIATGAGSDTSSYNTIPIKYENAIVARTVWWLTSVDSSQKEVAAGRFADLMGQATLASAAGKPGNDRVKKW